MFSFLKIIGRILLVILLIAILLALVGYISTYTTSLKQSVFGGNSTSTSGAPSVTIGSTAIPVEVARDEESMQRGLSGRPSLDQNSGMLFIFPRASIYSFWMPDMHFAIDLFWINSAGQVVGIEQNMSPDFDPNNPRYYRPSEPAQFVVEVNAGFAQRNNLHVGDRVMFNNVK